MKTLYQSSQNSYEVIEPIGEGGTATVFKAICVETQEEVALKVFHSHLTAEETNTECVDELVALSTVTHSNVVSTIDAGLSGDDKFIVMELLNGADLELFLPGRQFEAPHFLSFAFQSLSALTEIHSHGVYHLDIKPSNIMMSTDKNGNMLVKLVDFGSARTQSSNHFDRDVGKRGLKGSIYYMSPEQINKESPDHRSDIYSLGCVFYRILTGKLAFDGKSAVDVMASHIQGKYTPILELAPEWPQSVATIVELMIETKPENRPSSIPEILKAMQVMQTTS